MSPRIKKIVDEITIDPFINEYEPNYKLKKKRGRKVDNYIFNYTNIKITDDVILALIKNSNKAKKYLFLEEHINSLLKFINYTNFFKSNKIDEEKVNLFISENFYVIDFKLPIDEIKNRFVLELYQIKERNLYPKNNIQCIGLRYNYEKDIINSIHITELIHFRDKIFNEDEFYDLFSKNHILKSKYFLIRKYSLILNNYQIPFSFPDLENDFEAIKLNDLPFNYIDSQPKYFYPILPNDIVIPLTDKKYTYGNKNVNAYQQIELSTASTHNAYYYRKATFYYTFDFDKVLKYLYLYIDDFKDDTKNIDFLKSIETDLKEVLDNNLPIYSIIIKIEKTKQYKDNIDTIKNYVYSLFNIKKLFNKDKIELISDFKKIIVSTHIDILIKEVIIIQRDLDLYGNPIPIYYKLENGKQILVMDIEKTDDLYPTNFIVAKGKNKNGKIISIPIDSIQEYGIDYILNNNIDFPVYPGSYDIRTPYSIYYPPKKNNIIKKGLICSDGELNYNFLKRTRILYIPNSSFTPSGERIKINQEHFTLSEGRELSNLPVLAYSYLLTPMTENDKLIYLKTKYNTEY